MKPLSERDENLQEPRISHIILPLVGMKPLSERDENRKAVLLGLLREKSSRNEATL